MDLTEDDAEIMGDALPADLDISGINQIYEFPNNSKRKLASVLYLVVGAICVFLGVGVDSPLVNAGLTVVGVGLIAFALYGLAAAASTAVDEGQALVVAARTAEFAPGPASAQMIWRGWRSRPAWRVLVYSNEPQPLQRAVVVVDAIGGTVIESLVEENPEDWSMLAG